MTHLDKTFCASPNCKNECGRKMTDKERHFLGYMNNQRVSHGYFCGEPGMVYIPQDGTLKGI